MAYFFMWKEKYFEIIDFRKQHPISENSGQYYETHHIVPRSVCQLLVKVETNLVNLLPEEHFLAHYYIWKWFRDELCDKKWAKKMCYAFTMMKRAITTSTNIEKMSELYAEVRQELSALRKGEHLTESTKKKLSTALKGKTLGKKELNSLKYRRERFLRKREATKIQCLGKARLKINQKKR